VTNGLAVRMAVLFLVNGGDGDAAGPVGDDKRAGRIS